MSLALASSLRLDHAWNGALAPAGTGGAARLERAGPDLLLSWDVLAREPLRSPASDPAFHDGLWEHDVVELFLAQERLPSGPVRYLELEAGAAGHWLALDLADVRRRRAELPDLSVRMRGRVTCEGHGHRWQGRLAVPEREVVAVVGPGPWRGLAAAGLGGSATPRVYLTSARLPGQRPDFHQPRHWPLIG